MTAYFISDLHIVNMEEDRTQLFLHFLANLPPNTTHLFMVGDIFDLWLWKHSYFVKKYGPIIEALTKLKQRSVEIHYFEGNHDLYLRPYFENELGFRVHQEAQTFQLGNLRVRVEHGDQMDPDDRGYIFLRWFLRTYLMRWIVCHFPEKWIRKLGTWASQKSRKYTSEVKVVSSDQAKEKIRSFAQRQFALTRDFDLLVSGHVHIKDDFEFKVGSESIRAVNLGTWLTEPTAFCVTSMARSWISILK